MQASLTFLHSKNYCSPSQSLKHIRSHIMNKLLIVALFAQGHLAAFHSPALLARQLVTIPCSDQGMKDCGDGCIDIGWTCCPSGAGGCSPSDYCDVGSNGEDACCPDGEVCQGPGGVSTDLNTQTIISTITYETTSTIFEETPTTSAEQETTTIQVPPIETETPTLPITTVTTVSLPTLSLNETITGTATTGPATTTTEAVVPTGAAAHNGFSASNMVGGLMAGVVALFL